MDAITVLGCSCWAPWSIYVRVGQGDGRRRFKGTGHSKRKFTHAAVSSPPQSAQRPASSIAQVSAFGDRSDIAGSNGQRIMIIFVFVPKHDIARLGDQLAATRPRRATAEYQQP